MKEIIMKAITLNQTQMDALSLLIDFLNDGGRDEWLVNGLAQEYEDYDCVKDDPLALLIGIFNASLDN